VPPVALLPLAVVVLPVAIVVPPVALLPLVVVVPPVAIDVPPDALLPLAVVLPPVAVVVLPVAVAVPPVALLPLAVVVPPLAIVVLPVVRRAVFLPASPCRQPWLIFMFLSPLRSIWMAPVVGGVTHDPIKPRRRLEQARAASTIAVARCHHIYRLCLRCP
jgi:hypothetical protein